MNHAQWKTRRTRQMFGEKAEPSQAYTNAGDAMALGQTVHDRRKELGLSQKDAAERADMMQPQISTIEQASAEPTLAFLRRLAKALEARLSIDLELGRGLHLRLHSLDRGQACAGGNARRSCAA
ncbi:helix-turn-helix domain-containing protein [Streptomyces sp. NPDC051572]|uniref:helix-turn-helix domain-containing protein n=1 Tax=Streptomyces sp. NPDC051572 TaxID=3155802 RepID=UPI00344E87FB